MFELCGLFALRQGYSTGLLLLSLWKVSVAIWGHSQLPGLTPYKQDPHPWQVKLGAQISLPLVYWELNSFLILFSL